MSTNNLTQHYLYFSFKNMISGNYTRLKILHLISGDLWAGAETMAYTLLNSLQDCDSLDLSIITLNEGKLSQKLRTRGLNVMVIDENTSSFLDIIIKIREIVGLIRPNIIHSHRYKENFLAFLVATSFRRTKLIATQHGLPEHHDQKTWPLQRLKTRTNFLILSHFFTTVAVSDEIRSTMIKQHGFSSDRIEVIHNGVTLPTPSKSKMRGGTFVIGSSGRLFPVKDYALLVEIARLIAAIGADEIIFELAGEGPERIMLEQMIARYGLQDRFILRGDLHDMDSFYRGLDLYLNTSLHEGIPMTILEALAHGIPVIAPAVGGIIEIITNGNEGFLIGTRSPEDFSAACLYMMNNPDARDRMALAARETAERAFSSKKMAEAYHQLYKRSTSDILVTDKETVLPNIH